MEPTGQSGGSGRKVLVIILIVLGAGGFVLMLGCAGCIYLGYTAYKSSVPAAQASADAFLDELKADHVDAAYDSTSSTFRSAQTKQQFRDFVSRVKTLKTQTSRSIDSSSLFEGTGGKKVTLKITLHSPDNATSCTIVLVEEQGQWKVEKISVP
jgi:hypothetical protein